MTVNSLRLGAWMSATSPLSKRRRIWRSLGTWYLNS
jgi:hypothetical protein